METTQGIGIFPSVPEGTKIINPKYGEPSKEDYDASTVEKGKTRIIFELDGAKWDYPVVFEVENGRLFLTSARPKKEGYEFVGWDEDWKANNGGVVVYKAKWLRKETSDNNGSSNTDNTKIQAEIQKIILEQIQEDTSHMKILIQEIMEMQEIPLIMVQ